jgi:hypothetical protein
VEANELTSLRKKGGVPSHRRCPGIGVAGVLDFSEDVDSPVLRFGGLVADALEGDEQLDLEAERSDPPL